LLRELPGILNWAIQGLLDWKEQKLNPPAQVLNSTGAYRKDNDSVGQWIEDVCIVHKDRKSSMTELYESYEAWCDKNGLKAISNSSLGKDLNRRGFQGIKERAGNARLGIGLQEATKAPWMKVG
jgi:putative DNA primase/helicase